MSGGGVGTPDVSVHRGNTREAMPVLTRGRRIDRISADRFMRLDVEHGARGQSSSMTKPRSVAPPPSILSTPPRQPAVARPIALPSCDVARLAIVPLISAHTECTVALAVATAERLARAAARDGALVTMDSGAVKIGRPLRRHKTPGLALDGFDSLATLESVCVLDSADAHAAALAATGLAPLICVVSADDRLATALTEIQPSSVLLLADCETSESYLDLARCDLAADRPKADVFVARFAGRTPVFDGALALYIDRAAGARMRFGLAPSAVMRENADLLARRVIEGRSI